jgi:hypothetical protein
MKLLKWRLLIDDLFYNFAHVMFAKPLDTAQPAL